MTASLVRLSPQLATPEGQSLPARMGWGVAGGQKVLRGWHAMRNAAGYLVPITAATGLTSAGMATADADNTNGSDGDLVVDVWVQPVNVPFCGGGADALTDAMAPCVCWGLDNQTIGATSGSGARSVYGLFLGVDTSTNPSSYMVWPGPVAAALCASLLATGGAIPSVALTDASPTIQIGSGTWRTLPASTLTQDRTLTIGTTGAVAGSRMRIVRLDLTAFHYTIVDGGSGTPTLAVLPAGRVSFIVLEFDGTNWQILDLGALPGPATIAGTNLTDAAASPAVGGGNWYTLPAATLTAARTATLSTTGAKAGDEITITRLDVSGFAYTIVDGGSGTPTLVVLPGGEVGFVTARYDGTNWKLVRSGSMVDDWVVGTALADTASTTVQRGGRRTSFLLGGTMSQDETITLGTTGAQKGDVIRIIRTSTSAHTAAIVNGGGGAGTLVTLPNSKVNFAEAMFDGTNWLFQMCGTQ